MSGTIASSAASGLLEEARHVAPRCHRSFTSVAAIASGAASKSSVSG